MKLFCYKKKLILLLFLMVFSYWNKLVFADTDDGRAGDTGAYMKMGVSARSIGMGGAVTAIGDDVYATFYNPAGLSLLSKREFGAYHAILGLDRHLNFVAYAHPLAKGALGVSWLNSSIEAIPRYEIESGNPVYKGEFDFEEGKAALAYSYPVSRFLKLGINLNYVYAKMLDKDANDFGGDFGLLWHYNKYLNIGLSIKNLLQELDWNTDSERRDKFPVSVSTAVAFKFNSDLIVAFEYERTRHLQPVFKVGVEKLFKDKFALRCGYNGDNFSVGGGIIIKNFDFDYAYIEDALDSTHRFAFTLKFGPEHKREEPYVESIPLVLPEIKVKKHKEIPVIDLRKLKQKEKKNVATILQNKKKELKKKKKKKLQKEPSLKILNLLQKGNNLLSEKKYKLALECYFKAIKSNPKYAESYYKAGNAYLFLGNRNEAVKYFKKGLELNPNSSYASYARLILGT